MKAILLGLAAFALSLAATTAAVVKLHRPVPVPVVKADTAGKKAPADTVAKPRTPDSTVKAAAESSAVKTPAPRDSSVSAKRDTTTPARTDSTVPVSAGPTPGPGHGPAPALAALAARMTDPKQREQAYKQVARIFSAMKPPEAAKVLAFLSDEEVEGILRAVGPRQAADFMTNLPKERAAVLSRRLLIPRKETGA